jgi:hypothetical protein
MITTIANIDEQQQTIIVIVLQPSNLERMRQADPVTMESKALYGSMETIKYPDRVRIMVAYEEDQSELYSKMAQQDQSFIEYLMRGYQYEFNKVRRASESAVHEDEGQQG